MCLGMHAGACLDVCVDMCVDMRMGMLMLQQFIDYTAVMPHLCYTNTHVTITRTLYANTLCHDNITRATITLMLPQFIDQTAVMPDATG